jgi:hypothetical protein
MRRFIVLALANVVILFPLFTYTYLKGGIDGVARYQHSRQFALTLYSMYMFGVREGHNACEAGR